MSLEEALLANTAALKDNTEALRQAIAAMDATQAAPVTVTANAEPSYEINTDTQPEIVEEPVAANAAAEETVKKRAGRKPKVEKEAAPEAAEAPALGASDMLTDAIQRITSMGDQAIMEAQKIIRSYGVERGSQIAKDEDKLSCRARLLGKIVELEEAEAEASPASLV